MQLTSFAAAGREAALRGVRPPIVGASCAGVACSYQFTGLLRIVQHDHRAHRHPGIINNREGDESSTDGCSLALTHGWSEEHYCGVQQQYCR